MTTWLILTTAFFTGFVGSLHCIGMCGPIALALPIGRFSPLKKMAGILLYNLGRVCTYGLLGLVIGLAGFQFKLVNYQQVISIVIGLLLLLSLLPYHKYSLSLPAQLFYRFKSQFTSLLKESGLGGLFLLGTINGLLPCGTIYVALSAALMIASPAFSMYYMMIVGLGTLPMMVGISLTSLSFKRFQWNKITPALTLVFALFFIVRGLGLGIPFVSPSFDENMKQVSHENVCSK